VLACRRYDAKADLWSVGAILWEMLVGLPPYGGANHVALLRSIEAAPPTLPANLAAGLSGRCVALLTALLTRDPVARISFPEFFTHPFLAPSSAESSSGAPTQQQGCVVCGVRLCFARCDADADAARRAGSPKRGAPPRAANMDDDDESPPPFALGAGSDSDEAASASGASPQPASAPPRPSPLAAAAAAHGPLPRVQPQRRASSGARAAAAAAVSAAELTLQPVDASALPLGLAGGGAAEEGEDDAEYVLVESPQASTSRAASSAAAAALYGRPSAGGLSRRLSGAAAVLLSAATAATTGSSPPPGSPGFARPPRQPVSPSGGASPPAMPWSRAAAASPLPPQTPPPLPPSALAASGASPPASSPPLAPAARVAALQRCAGILDALATERAQCAAPTEALALYLLALACVRGAAASALAAGTGAAALGARLARAGDAVLARALATGAAASAAAAPRPPPPAARSPGASSPGSPAGGAHLPPRPPPSVPDGWELAHTAAMALGRQGGAEELLGRPAAAVSCYGRALSLLGLMLREGATLPPSPACPPLALAPQQRLRLQRAAVALRGRAEAAARQAGMGALQADESWPQ
jgi:hypothetical protein